MNINKLFVYGTLKEPDKLQKLLGWLPNTTSDSIVGFTRGSLIIDDEEFPAIVPSQTNNEIGGLVLHELDEIDFAILDDYETLNYQRIRVRTQAGLWVWVYIENY